jgi:hypothetical protein
MIIGPENRDFEIQGFILIDCVEDVGRPSDNKFYKRILKIIKRFGQDTSPIINAATGLRLDLDNRSIQNTLALYSDHSELHRMIRRGLEQHQGTLTTPDNLKLRMNNEYCFAFIHPGAFFYHVSNHLENKITNWLILGRTWNMCVHDNSIGLRSLHRVARGFGLNFYAIDGGFQKSDLTTTTRADIDNDYSLRWAETNNSMYKLKLSKKTGLAGYTNSANNWIVMDPQQTMPTRLE